MGHTRVNQDELLASLTGALQRLVDSCTDCMLPFDTYCAMATLRACEGVRAYAALVDSDCFTGCSIIARSQLDSLARLNGVMGEPDPHALAQNVIEGEPLRRKKGSAGEKLTDGYLVKLLAQQNPWVQAAYDLLNESVHLSSLHYKTLLAQGLHTRDGEMVIQYFKNSSYVQQKDKDGLDRMFVKLTEAVPALLNFWRDRRPQVTATQQWLRKAADAGII
jgi:hypothetical protein